MGRPKQSLREIVPAPLYGQSYRTFSRKSWRKAELASERPMQLAVFTSQGGARALEWLHAWALVQLVRREEAAGIPNEGQGKGCLGGFSLPDMALRALDIDRVMRKEADWARRLVRFVFLDGWTMVRRETAYYIPDDATEREMDGWERVIRECEDELETGWRALRRCSVTGVRDSEMLQLLLLIGIEILEQLADLDALYTGAAEKYRDLQESQMIVLHEGEQPPVQAKAQMSLLVRRWTFDPAEFDFGLPEGKAPLRSFGSYLSLILQRIAIRLELGSVLPRASEDWAGAGYLDE